MGGCFLQLADDILNAVCETVILQKGKSDPSYRHVKVCVKLPHPISRYNVFRWLGDLLAVLSKHTALHMPLYLRLTELLTTQVSVWFSLYTSFVHYVCVCVCVCVQLPDLTSFQLLALALLLSKTLCHSPCMATVMDGQNSLSVGVPGARSRGRCEVPLSCLQTGEEYCVGLLSGLRHDTATCMSQSLR